MKLVKNSHLKQGCHKMTIGLLISVALFSGTGKLALGAQLNSASQSDEIIIYPHQDKIIAAPLVEENRVLASIKTAAPKIDEQSAQLVAGGAMIAAGNMPAGATQTAGAALGLMGTLVSIIAEGTYALHEKYIKNPFMITSSAEVKSALNSGQTLDEVKADSIGRGKELAQLECGKRGYAVSNIVFMPTFRTTEAVAVDDQIAVRGKYKVQSLDPRHAGLFSKDPFFKGLAGVQGNSKYPNITVKHIVCIKPLSQPTPLQAVATADHRALGFMSNPEGPSILASQVPQAVGAY